MTRNKILDSNQIERKFQRIARQILEDHHTENEIVLVGIDGQGLKVAKRLLTILNSISDTKIIFEKISLNKENPLSSEITFSSQLEELENKTVVLVDDVLNSGKTLIYAVKHILDSGPKGVYTTVLVDRIHPSFPIRADYCGLSLSTNLNEHITVKLNSIKSASDSAYLHI